MDLVTLPDQRDGQVTHERTGVAILKAGHLWDTIAMRNTSSQLSIVVHIAPHSEEERLQPGDGARHPGQRVDGRDVLPSTGHRY